LDEKERGYYKGEIEPDQEERLRWYFEDHLASPFTDREKAKRAEKSIAFYGEFLFAHLFAQNEALIEWRNLVNGLDKIRVQVFYKDPEFQDLHWEALKDPKEKKAFCLTGVEFTRTSGAVSEAIFKCINISFSLLTPKARESVLVFAPFTSFFNGMFLEEYSKELQASEAFTHLTLSDLEEALNQGKKQGLLKEVFPQCFSIQPVFPFFLGQQVEQSLDETGKAVLEQAFCNYMTIIGKEYTAIIRSKKAEEKQLGLLLFKHDRENLYKALHRVLDNQGDFYTLYDVFCAFYHQQPLYNEAVGFMEGVVSKLDLFLKKEQSFLAHYAVVVGNLGNNYQQIKNFPKARNNYKKGLKFLQKAGKQKESSIAYHQLGYLAQEERDWKEAKRNYLEALKIKQEFNDRYSQARTYLGLGAVAIKENDYALSIEYFVTGLEIYNLYNDEYHKEMAIGNLSELMKEWDAAEAIEQLEKEEETKKVLRAILEEVKKE
jgi:tetratricopeptide (TPR) repeat protein